MTSNLHSPSASANHSVAVVGAGNIGSQLIPLLAKASEIGRLVIVDPDRYNLANLAGQNITEADLGAPKVAAMERRVATIRSDLDTITLEAFVEDVPMGQLRADVLVSCVDSRRARQAINTIAWRLGMPWLDGAVQADALLGRIALYMPGTDQPCQECRWSDTDYDLLETVYACRGAAPAAATSAPAELGALVAAHQAIAVRQLLRGETGFARHELFINAQHAVAYNSTFNRNPACRFDHQVHGCAGTIVSNTTLGRLASDYHARYLSVEGHAFVFDTACPSCTRQHNVTPMLHRAVQLPACPRCGAEQEALGQSMREHLPLQNYSRSTLTNIGLRRGDLLTLHAGGHVTHLEIGRST